MIERWVASYEVSPERLGAYRVVYALFVLLVIAPGHTLLTNFRTLARFPDSFFRPPPGPMMLVDGFPPEAFFTGVLVAVYLGTAALLVGYRTRAASLLLGAALLVGFGFSYSFGKVNHSILFVLAPLVMAFSGWGAAYSADAAQRSARAEGQAQTAAWPLALLALLVGFSFFMAGFEKTLGGWLDPTTQAVRGQFFNHFFVNGRQDLLAPWFLQVSVRPFWELLDVLTIVMEMGFLVAVAWPWAARCFAAVATLFHFSVMLMFNIPFVENLAVYAAFFCWTALLPAHGSAVRQRAGAWLARHMVAVLAILLVGGIFFQWGSPLMAVDRFAPAFPSGLHLYQMLVLSGAAVLAGGFLLRTFWRAMRPAREASRVHEAASS